MRIAINCRSFLKKQYTGIGRYAYHLVKSLTEIDEKNEYGTTTGILWEFETVSELGTGMMGGSLNGLSWSIFPNPVSGNQVTFQNPGKNPATIYLHNSSGSLVRRIYSLKPMVRLLTEDLSAGIYPVSIKASDMTWIYNLVIL